MQPISTRRDRKKQRSSANKTLRYPGYLLSAGLLIVDFHISGFAQWLGQSRTSFSDVLSQNETWWSPAWSPLEQQRYPLSSLLLVVVCTRCATQDYYAQVWRLDLHERCECMLDSVVQMYVGHQMLSTAGMELCNHQKFRILAQN